MNLSFDPQYFSIQDKIGQIMKTPDGAKFIKEMIQKINTEMKVSVNEGMLLMVKGFSVDKVFKMFSDRVPEDIRPWVNERLQTIKKPTA